MGYVAALKNKRIQQQRKLNRNHKDRQSLTSSKLKLLILEKYRNELDILRNLHYTTIEVQYDSLINDKKWLINPNETKMNNQSRKAVDYLIDSDDDDDLNHYFSQQNVLKFKKRNYFMLTLLVLCVTTFWISFFRIYWKAAFFDRVAVGFKIFEQTTDWYDWVVFFLFVIAWSIRYYSAIRKALKNSGKQIWFCLKCCRINKNIESRFNTPYFDTTRFDKDGNLKQSEKDSPSSSLPQKDDKQKQKLVENDDDHKEIQEIEEIEDEQDDLGKIYDL